MSIALCTCSCNRILFRTRISILQGLVTAISSRAVPFRLSDFDRRGIGRDAMRIFTLYTAGLLLFPLTVFTLDPGFLDLQFDGPMTFWVDQTCRSTRRKEAFNAALDEAIKMASRAYYRLGISTDALTAGNINILFHEQNVQGQQDKTRNLAKSKCFLSFDRHLFTISQELFGTQPHAGSGISVWKEDQDRLKSNIRIYCDGDPQKTNPNRPSRWKLAPDPALDKQPQGYVKQSARPRAGPGVPKPSVRPEVIKATS